MQLDKYGRALTPEYLAWLEQANRNKKAKKWIAKRIKMGIEIPKIIPKINQHNVRRLYFLFQKHLDPNLWHPR